MMPDKIYVREYPDGINQFWDRKKRDDVVATIHHEYIRKDALLEWLKEQMEHYPHADNGIGWGQWDTFRRVIEKIESL